MRQKMLVLKFEAVFALMVIVSLLLGSIKVNAENEKFSNEILGEDFYEKDSAISNKYVSIDMDTREITEFEINNVFTRSNAGFTPGYVGSETKQAELEEIEPRQIIGTDGRTVVPDTTVYPYSCVCYCKYTYPDGYENSATAWLAGRSFAVTSGHVVYNSSHGGFAKSMAVYPGYDKGAPFGRANVKKMIVFDSWLEKGGPQEDVAVITLDRAIGDKAGYFGYEWGTTLQNQKVRLSGYPKKFGKIMYTGKGFVKKTAADVLSYTNDAVGGQSGSPVYKGSTVFAIHSRYDKVKYNEGKRITLSTFNLFNSYR